MYRVGLSSLLSPTITTITSLTLIFQFALLVASAAAVPVQLEQNRYGPAPVPYGPSPAYAPSRAYKPKPVYPVEEEEEEFAPQPYKYEYGVQDDYSKAAFAKSETQNEVGAVTGSYKVRLTRLTPIIPLTFLQDDKIAVFVGVKQLTFLFDLLVAQMEGYFPLQ